MSRYPLAWVGCLVLISAHPCRLERAVWLALPIALIKAMAIIGADAATFGTSPISKSLAKNSNHSQSLSISNA